MTTNEQRALNARIALLRNGDDLTCWNADGTERTERAITASYEWARRSWESGYGGWGTLWQRRHGQSWQADLDAHVSAWKTDPPPYCTDYALCFEPGGLWEELREEWNVEITTSADGPYCDFKCQALGAVRCYIEQLGDIDHDFPDDGQIIKASHVKYTDTICEAVCLAWVAAKEAELDVR